jgi:DNA-binding protein HU-beta
MSSTRPANATRTTATSEAWPEHGRDATMTQTDVVTRMAQAAVLTQRQAARALRALTTHLQTSLSRGDWVTLAGFGPFAVRMRGARTGRNPRSGQTLAISAQGPSLQSRQRVAGGRPRLPRLCARGALWPRYHPHLLCPPVSRCQRGTGRSCWDTPPAPRTAYTSPSVLALSGPFRTTGHLGRRR